MHVSRGRADSIDADHARTASTIERAELSGEPALRVWTPHRQVAFGRRDVRADGYDRARTAASQQGFRPVERRVGGRAVAYTGSTVAFVRAIPEVDRTAIQSRYETATRRLRRALDRVGVEAVEGEPEGAFCPGSHSLSADGKVAGLGQRVRHDLAVVAGVVVVRDHAAIAGVLDPVYEALSVPFDPASVGSVARAGGDSDPDAVVAAVLEAFDA